MCKKEKSFKDMWGGYRRKEGTKDKIHGVKHYVFDPPLIFIKGKGYSQIFFDRPIN